MTSPVQIYQLLDSKNIEHRGVKVGFINELYGLTQYLKDVGLTEPRMTLVIVGGASGLDSARQAQLESLFHKVLAPLAEEMQLYVVDGGTDAGVMSLMGDARTAIGGTFPLIGVAPRSLVSLPDQPVDHPYASTLEPNHTHCILVPGEKWGDESVWISQVATHLSGSCESMTVLINGGSVTVQDAYASVNAGREIVIIAGTGRIADDIVEALRYKVVEGKQIADPKIARLLDQSDELLTAIDLDNRPCDFIQDLKLLLSE
ncbi:hypothetical protein PN498_24705 [Oscillatoria sp. CS-180]|uniref:hypothetical protein n=1 Tax=Oscillatoria sp. CS-180 TaxID=3021720 RepID=UPI00232F9FF9|nr:hypothetical protein [Oscillatoria sp. CS-180]MDB9529216.1 hypothetical protein [Oscillatoria sp. CS-180]